MFFYKNDLLVIMFLPQEVWYIVCEYLPLTTLQNFNVTNKTVYNCIRRYCTKLLYDEGVKYKDDILPQIIALTDDFIIFSCINYYMYRVNNVIIAEPVHRYFIIIENNNNCKKKVLFTISQLTCYLVRGAHEIYQEYYKCSYNNVNGVLKHVVDNNYCYSTFPYITLSCIVNYPHDHYSVQLQTDVIPLIIEKSHLKFVSNDAEHYNCPTYIGEATPNLLIHKFVDNVPVVVPRGFIKKVITEFHFVLESTDVTQILENVFILENNKVISSFVKDGITFCIMSKVRGTQIHKYCNSCKDCPPCNVCNGSCKVCNAACLDCWKRNVTL